MAWNEPGGGNKDRDPWKSSRSDKVPNLDEALGRLSKKMGGAFGQGGGPSAAGLGGLVALAIGLWLASGIYIVSDGQRGVVMQFGKFVGTSLPGPHWHMPYPVQTVETVDVDQYRGKQLKMPVLTEDENIVEVEVASQYNVKDPAQYLFNVRDPDGTLQDVMQSAIREVIGTRDMDRVLTEGRTEIAAGVKSRMQEMLDAYQTGLDVKSVNLQDVQPPEAVQGAFADAIKAREDEQRFVNEAEAYRNEVVPRARGAATQIVEEARGYRTRVVKAAEGEASRFNDMLTEYRKAPEVTRERLYIETMERVLAQSGKVLMDTPEGSNNVVYLPLDRMARDGARAAPAEATPSPVTVPGTPVAPRNVAPATRDPNRARTDLRTREAP